MNRVGSDVAFGFVYIWVKFSLGFYSGIQDTQRCSHCDDRSKNKAKGICLCLISKHLISQSKPYDQRKTGRKYTLSSGVMKRIGWILLLQGSVIQPPSPDHVIVSSPTGRVASFVSLSVHIASYTAPVEESNDCRPALVPEGFCAPQTAPGGCDITGQKD